MKEELMKEELIDIIGNIENYNSKELKLLQLAIKQEQEKRFDDKFIKGRKTK